MSAAETSAYLLMAGGLIWVLVGIAGLVWRRGNGLRTGRDRAEHEEAAHEDQDHQASVAEQEAKKFAREEQDKLDSQ
jgi:hypothetical protein